MSNDSSCIFVLTQLIGFEKSENEEKLTLPDKVENDSLFRFKNYLRDSSTSNTINDNSVSSSHEMKMDDNELFWTCHDCKHDNPIESNTCEMCDLPRNVCLFFVQCLMINTQN